MNKKDIGKVNGYGWTAVITLTDSKGNTKTFTEKHVKKLELVE